MQQSQLDPLPEVPFRIISKTIGRGAYASIKKAIPLDAPTPVFAVKLIHKGYAMKQGRISAKQIAMEVSLHSHIAQHPNIIEWFATGEDQVWRWIAMEFAAGGDLFDKIEADVGVKEDIAHLYFTELIGGVSFMHSKGVAHRDLKPENILLSDTGSLKIADFGMATLFEHKGVRKQSSTMCGSPPYIAPEVLTCARADKRSAAAGKYSADLVDIWSCGVILFVLLVGNTPWDEPTSGSWEFQEYVRTQGRSSDPLWARIPSDVLSLLRGMMNVDAKKRFSFTKVRQHPWYMRPNSLLTPEGKVRDQVELATQMLGGMRIDLSEEPTLSQPVQKQDDDAMDVDQVSMSKLPSTQPEIPICDPLYDDWEPTTLRTLQNMSISSTQPLSRANTLPASTSRGKLSFTTVQALADEPSMSQFSQTGVPLSLTQTAKRFKDIVPAYTLARFFSHMPPALLVQMLSDALHQLGISLPPVVPNLYSDATIATLKVRTSDGRKQSLHGDIIVDRYRLPDDQELLEVRFVKVKGDPLEWRRFFKKTALLCKDGIFNPEQ
ncbi:kinase-like domain-containing protein [Apodospora peruviana]|uniref:non-specific serine/threonine protein kinase n=1 Tax=Apodospora peruviana TaxID=516989 RepID=A0AAE0ME60_9PEZI|nr:kinase-like domain-containing protein [Apodospora peruviana]